MAKDKGTRAPGGDRPGAGAAGPDVKIPDPVELARTMGQIAERSQKLVAEFLRRQSQKPGMGMADPMNVGQAFLDMTARLMANPTSATAVPFGVYLTSGSRVTFPMSMTLLRLGIGGELNGGFDFFLG